MAELGERAREAMHEPEAELRVVYELRYRGQSFELPIAAGLETRRRRSCARRFEREHEERYGYHDSEQKLELVTIRVTATAEGTDVELAGGEDDPESVERSTREADAWTASAVELEVLRGIPAPGTEIEGPAVVELPESTLLIPPGWDAEVDDTGTIRMSRS